MWKFNNDLKVVHVCCSIALLYAPVFFSFLKLLLKSLMGGKLSGVFLILWRYFFDEILFFYKSSNKSSSDNSPLPMYKSSGLSKSSFSKSSKFELSKISFRVFRIRGEVAAAEELRLRDDLLSRAGFWLGDLLAELLRRFFFGLKIFWIKNVTLSKNCFCLFFKLDQNIF